MLKSKFLKFSAFSLAAIALAFNFAACDSGNDEYIPETPTTYREFNATGNGVCTAHWTFATDKASIGASEVSLEGKEIPADEGTGAKLVGANGLGIKYNAGLQAGRKSVVLEENPGAGPALKLTTTAQTNLTFKVAGAGAADPTWSYCRNYNSPSYRSTSRVRKRQIKRSWRNGCPFEHCSDATTDSGCNSWY